MQSSPSPCPTCVLLPLVVDSILNVCCIFCRFKQQFFMPGIKQCNIDNNHKREQKCTEQEKRNPEATGKHKQRHRECGKAPRLELRGEEKSLVCAYNFYSSTVFFASGLRWTITVSGPKEMQVSGRSPQSRRKKEAHDIRQRGTVNQMQ